jgi:hypothetical protein
MPEWLVFIPLGVAVIGGLAAAHLWTSGTRRRAQTAMEILAGSRGGDVFGSTAWGGPTWEHQTNAFTMKLSLTSNDADNNITRMVLTPLEPLQISIGPERSRWDLTRPFRSADVQVGIPTFDNSYLLQGADPADVLSRMGAKTREAMDATLKPYGAVMKNGSFRVDLKGWVVDEEALIDCFDAITALGEALIDHPGSNAEALLQHALTTPDPDVRFRRNCLKMLLADYPASVPAGHARRLGAVDQDAGMRFLVARLRGTDGLADVRALAACGELPEDLQAAAVALLSPHHGGALALEEAEAGALSVEASQGVSSEQDVTESAHQTAVKPKQNA